MTSLCLVCYIYILFIVESYVTACWFFIGGRLLDYGNVDSLQKEFSAHLHA